MKYSVIVPVYNAEDTIKRCVDSLLSEQYSDAEIILVNDGSKDSSGMICQTYALEHKSVRYIAKKNGGVSSARNTGLDAAKGTYIVFVDSDDYVSSRFFETMDRTLEAHPCDLIQFSFCIDDGKTKLFRKNKVWQANTREQLMPHIIEAICRKTLNPPWGKIYRRDLIEKSGIRFPEGASVAEDRAFNIEYSLYIESYAVLEDTLYYVNTENEDSLSRGRHMDLQEQFEIVDASFIRALQSAPNPSSEKDQYQRAYNFGDCRSIYHDAKLLHRDHVTWQKRQKLLGNKCDEINRKHMKYPNSRYCLFISLPVRLRLTWVIDAIGWKLTH